MNIKLWIGSILRKLESLKIQYEKAQLIKTFAEFGSGSNIGWPFIIRGTNQYTPNVKYIHIGDNVSIGSGATIFSTRAHIYIYNRAFSGPNLTIMTGDHPYDIIGKYIAENRKVDLEKEGVDISKYDKDVIIKEDVWLGCNVTILKGVTIGRGAIVAAGSVVTKSLPDYCIAGGCPAKVLKFRWSIEKILEHESKLYKEDQRISKEQLAANRANLLN